MSVYNTAQQFPSAASSIHAYHAQNLKEAQTTQGACGKNLTGSAHAQHNNGCQDGDDIFAKEKNCYFNIEKPFPRNTYL